MSSGPNHQPTEQETRAANALSVYAKISDPMAAVAQLGEQFFKSQIMRVSTPGDGAVLALTCICEGITPLEFVRTYHIIEGRPSMRADAMAAKFLAAGGSIEWHEIGEAGKPASATFTFGRQSIPMAFSLDDARRMLGKTKDGQDVIDKPNSNWQKDPGAMLRARLVSKAVRILAPHIVVGVYTPEELQDVAEPTAAPPQRSSRKAATPPPADPPAPEPQPVQPVQQPTVETDPDVIDADFTVTPTVTTIPPEHVEVSEVVPVINTTADDDLPVTADLLQELVAVASQFPGENGARITADEINARLCRFASVDSPSAATRGQVRSLISRCRAALSR
ncbi:MAG: hypothetical protein ACK528_05780 [Alphaproteobacteria bacterium]